VLFIFAVFVLAVFAFAVSAGAFTASSCWSGIDGSKQFLFGAAG
jgi:hypothetical protein